MLKELKGRLNLFFLELTPLLVKSIQGTIKQENKLLIIFSES